MDKIRLKDLSLEDKLGLYEQLTTANRGSTMKVVKKLCKKYGISQKTLYGWRNNIKSLVEADQTKNYLYVKGKSTLTDKDGNVKMQWVKEDTDRAKFHKMMEESIEGLVSRVDGMYEPSKVVPKMQLGDVMTFYTIGDAHLGMLATQAEAGNENNLAGTERDLLTAMDLLLQQSVPSKECFIVDVGDYFHTDNGSNRTNGHGHALDVDGRFHKVLETGLNLTVKMIEMALEKHEIVRWRSAVGNHNEHTAVMMSAFIKAYFRQEPRVIVHDTPNMFMYHQFGKNLIGITHGHTCKAEKLGEVMSVDCEEIWSESKFRYWYTGHVHHQSVKEFASCVVETFRTLNGKDAWHNGAGYRSQQDMKAITLHKDYGEVSRNTVNLALVRGVQNDT